MHDFCNFTKIAFNLIFMKTTVGIIEMKGKPLTIVGDLIQENTQAPNFVAIDKDFNTVQLRHFEGKNIIISAFPSVDTPVCAAQANLFNKRATSLSDTLIITISMDLPFALSRFCAANDIKNIITLSDFRDRDFGYKYGFYIQELGLLARGIIIISKMGKVEYVQYVKEITNEPDYEKVFDALKKLS